MVAARAAKTLVSLPQQKCVLHRIGSQKTGVARRLSEPTVTSSSIYSVGDKQLKANTIGSLVSPKIAHVAWLFLMKKNRSLKSGKGGGFCARMRH
eukprot:COSAG02_NODE_849_length_16548_cov_6.418384_3_plen_95_part_00